MEFKENLLATTSCQAEGVSENSLVDRFRSLPDDLLEDRFSSLPDDLALEVLSHIDFKDLIWVGSMSRRCRQLSTQSFNVCLRNVGHGENMMLRQLKQLTAFMRFLNRRGANKIQRLSIRLNVTRTLSRLLSQVIPWIPIAARCDVEELDLKFSVYNPTSSVTRTELTLADLQSYIFGSLRPLSEDWYDTFLRAPSVASFSLHSLSLDSIAIDEECCKWISCCKCIKELRFHLVEVEAITIESSSLELFSLVTRGGVVSLLNISGVKLTDIHITWGFCEENTSLNISAPNLKNFTWIGNLLNHQNLGKLLGIEKAVIFLKHAEDNYDVGKIYQVLGSLCKVKVLIISEETVKAMFRKGSVLEQFSNVYYLSMHIEAFSDDLIPPMVGLLHAMPNLNTLHINSYQGVMPFSRKPKSTGRNRKYWETQNLVCIQQLKEVNIELTSGYNGMEFARYILEHAQSLKKMVVSYLPDQSYIVPKLNETRMVSSPVLVLQETTVREKELQSRSNMYSRYLEVSKRF